MSARRVVLTTDDPEKAFAELRRRRATGEDGWDMTEVRRMDDPPKTTSRWAVFQTLLDERDST